jgi:hypothetical protein
VTNIQLSILVRRARHVYMDTLSRDDVLMVRVYKNDILKLLAECPDNTGFDAELVDGTLYIHPAS